MSQYTSTSPGFQHAMQLCLTGAPDDAAACTEACATRSFYHAVNGTRYSCDADVAGLAEWCARVSAYKPVSEEFLRDVDQLAARLVGTIRVDGVDTKFESFVFGQVDRESGRLGPLVERAIWGPPGGAAEHGVRMSGVLRGG